MKQDETENKARHARLLEQARHWQWKLYKNCAGETGRVLKKAAESPNKYGVNESEQKRFGVSRYCELRIYIEI